MAEIYIRVNPKTQVVTFIHRRPFDPVNGLNTSRDDLLKTGFFVNDFPQPKTVLGKRAIAYYDHERKSVYYEYETAPFTDKKRLDLLEDSSNAILLSIGTLLSGMMNPLAGNTGGFGIINNQVPTTKVSSVEDAIKSSVKSNTMSINSTTKTGSTTTINTTKSVPGTTTSSNKTQEESKESEAATISSNEPINPLVGLVEYFASQIFQGKLSAQLVYMIYPTLKDQIEERLKSMDPTYSSNDDPE